MSLLNPGPALTREQILSVDDTTPFLQQIEVPEWGGPVWIRVISGLQRDRWETAIAKDASNNIRARLCALCLCDGAGKTLFSEADLVALGNKSALALNAVFFAAIRLNKIGKAEVDDLEKTSCGQEGSSADSPTDSPPATPSSTLMSS